MSTFVLIHGAWYGGWCWHEAAAGLHQHGHIVHTPTLMYLGEHTHLTQLPVDLETHIRDIVQLLRDEELNDVLLVGHGYAGRVVAGVIEQEADRILHAIYLDAILPANSPTETPCIEQRLLPPLVTRQKPMTLPVQRYRRFPSTFILCKGFPFLSLQAAQAKALGWEYRELCAGHDAMITAPDALIALLHRNAEEHANRHLHAWFANRITEYPPFLVCR